VKRLFAALWLVVAVLGVAAARELVEGARAVTASEQAIAREDRTRAIALARHAAEAVTPGSPYPARGYALLARIARDAEARGEIADATAAWRAIRAAAIETRGAGVDASAWKRAANEALARLGGADPAQGPTEAALLEQLSHDDTPTTLSFALLALAALAFYGGAFATFLPSLGRLRKAALVCAAAGAALYAVMMLHA
jgi:hypothetical protein